MFSSRNISISIPRVRNIAPLFAPGQINGKDSHERVVHTDSIKKSFLAQGKLRSAAVRRVFLKKYKHLCPQGAFCLRNIAPRRALGRIDNKDFRERVAHTDPKQGCPPPSWSPPSKPKARRSPPRAAANQRGWSYIRRAETADRIVDQIVAANRRLGPRLTLFFCLNLRMTQAARSAHNRRFSINFQCFWPRNFLVQFLVRAPQIFGPVFGPGFGPGFGPIFGPGTQNFWSHFWSGRPKFLVRFLVRAPKIFGPVFGPGAQNFWSHFWSGRPNLLVPFLVRAPEFVGPILGPGAKKNGPSFNPCD